MAEMISGTKKLCAYDRCRVVLPWFFWARGEDAVSRLRRRILLLDTNGPGREAGHGTKAAAAVLHVLRSGREAWLAWRRESAAVREGYGVARGRQLREIFAAAWRYNFPPMLYYRTRLFRLPRERWGMMFSHEETTLVLARFERAEAYRGLWTKSGWAEFCARGGPLSVPVVARAEGGRLVAETAGEIEPGRDLFLKPDSDFSGRGGVMLEWIVERDGWQASGACAEFVGRDGLREFLAARSVAGALVVQPRLRNAPDLADLASRALVNARVVTLRRLDGEFVVLMAALRVPPGDEPTSDVVGSTIALPVDLETGRLGLGESARFARGAMVRHPKSGARFEGREIAQWAEMKAKALAAHREHLAFMPSVGWDLVATDRGVLILEANAVWNGHLAQLWGMAPLGETIWPELMLAALDELEAREGKGAAAQGV